MIGETPANFMQTYFKEKKTKKHGLKWYKDKAWKAFSLFVRISNSDSFGMVVCCTCGVKKHYKKMQAGHFIPGRGSNILFDIRGVHPQCYGCNVPMKGNPRKYDAFMRAEYGQDVIDELDKLSDATPIKRTAQDYLDIKSFYKDKLEEYVKNRAIRQR